MNTCPGPQRAWPACCSLSRTPSQACARFWERVSPSNPDTRHGAQGHSWSCSTHFPVYLSSLSEPQAKPTQSQAHPTLITNPGTLGCGCLENIWNQSLDPQRPPTPADLLGVAHGLQDRMIQGLQGGQDVLIVPHVVHKVIWGKRKQRSGVVGGSCLSPNPTCAPPLPHTSWSLQTIARYLPHSSLVSTWLHREQRRGGLRSCSVPSPCPPSAVRTAHAAGTTSSCLLPPSHSLAP